MLVKEKRLMAWFLFSVGALTSAAAAAKPLAEGMLWPESLPFFLLASACSLTGLVVLYITNGDNKQTKLLEDPLPRDFINHLLTDLEALQQDLPKLSQQHFLLNIEVLLNTYVLPLGAYTQALSECGCHKDLPLVSAAAGGERLLNRMWSAAADGYMEEAERLCPRVVAAYSEARDFFVSSKVRYNA